MAAPWCTWPSSVRLLPGNFEKGAGRGGRIRAVKAGSTAEVTREASEAGRFGFIRARQRCPTESGSAERKQRRQNEKQRRKETGGATTLDGHPTDGAASLPYCS